MEPAAIPLVMVDEMPAISNAKANTMAALLPSNGSSKDLARKESGGRQQNHGTVNRPTDNH